MMRAFHPFPAAALAVVLAVGAPAAAGAQTAGPTPGITRSYVQLVRLHPDMVNEWIDLQRNEVIPAQKKAGVASRITLTTAVGNSFEFLIITPFPSWAAMDGEAPLVRALGSDGAARLNAKLRKCVLASQTYVVNRRDSLNIPAGDAPLWRTAIRVVQPGKMQEFLQFYRADILPALQKAKANGTIAGASLAFRGVGAMSGEFTETTHYTKFADLEGGSPVLAALGAEANTKVMAKGALLATTKQVVLRRRLPDLSY